MEGTPLKPARQLLRRWLVPFVPHIGIGGILAVLPLFTPSYTLWIVTKIFVLAIYSMSFDLIFGYTGLFSLGHAAFFGVGAYTTAVLTTRYGIEGFWMVAPASILMAGLFAAVFGLVVLRVRGISLLLVTFALGQLLFSIAWKWRAMTGGADGLSGIPAPIGVGLPMSSPSHFYYFGFLALIICGLLLYRIVNSPFGLTLVGICESELRMRALGYNTVLYKYISFILGGLFAGVAGVLYASLGGIVVPSDLGILTSASALLMVILGGPRTLWGPCIGTGLILLLNYFVSQYVPQRWPLVLGVFFVLSVLYARNGVAGRMLEFWRKAKQQYGSP